MTGLVARNVGQISLKYRGTGLKVSQNFSVGAIAVISNRADILDKSGCIVLPVKVVICKRFDLSEENRRQSGTPITAIDPGKEHDTLILLLAKATTTNPVRTVPKEVILSIGTCEKTDPPVCKGCCNFLKRKK